MPQGYDAQIALYTEFKEKYNDYFFAAQNVNDFTAFCEIIPSTTLIEDLNFLETIPQYREWIDGRALQAIGPAYHYSVRNRHWEVTIEIDRDAIDDNRLQLERQKVAHLGLEAGRAPWQMFVNGLAANGAGYDGIAYFSAAHTQNAQPVQTNIVNGTGITPAAIATDFATAKAGMRGLTDGQGRPMNLGQRGLVVLASQLLEQQFLMLANNTFIVTSTAAGVFGMQDNVLKGQFEVIIDPYLADTDDWYMFATAEPGLPMVYVNRQAPQFVAQDSPASEANFMNRMLRYGSDWRSQIGYGPWYMAAIVAQD